MSITLGKEVHRALGGCLADVRHEDASSVGHQVCALVKRASTAGMFTSAAL